MNNEKINEVLNQAILIQIIFLIGVTFRLLHFIGKNQNKNFKTYPL